MLNTPTIKSILALSLIPGLGAKRIKQLIQQFPDVTRIFSLSRAELRSVEGIGEASALSILSFDNWAEVEAILKRTQVLKANILTIADRKYPSLLKQIYDPPPVLWYKGNVDALARKGVAIVGTRNTTAYGRKMAKKFASELAENGWAINSGLAYGIDAIAHQAAVDANSVTVAVLGSGIDYLYPTSHTALANQIINKGGAVITEFPPGTKPDAGNFPVRNRVVSGLSYGVLVIESGIQGGSIITADLALDQNREVFALPHSLENPSGTGCNYLIKTGAAKLVQTVDDILEELPGEVIHSKKEEGLPAKETISNWRTLELDELSQKICALLEQGEQQVDAIGDSLEVGTSQLLVTLLQLEMQGVVVQKAGKIFSLR